MTAWGLFGMCTASGAHTTYGIRRKYLQVCLGLMAGWMGAGEVSGLVWWFVTGRGLYSIRGPHYLRVKEENTRRSLGGNQLLGWGAVWLVWCLVWSVRDVRSVWGPHYPRDKKKIHACCGLIAGWLGGCSRSYMIWRQCVRAVLRGHGMVEG